METGYLVALGVLWRDSVAYLFHADPKSSDRRGFIGSQALYPATLSGIGMALLASMETEDVLATYGEMESIPAFPGGADALLEELERIRKLGYAYIYSAPEKGHHTVAVTVGSPVECAIGFSGAISPEQAAKLADILHETARRIELGELEAASISDLDKRRSLPQPAI
jgi:DNA-binding IclR family transcriptional regulator